MCENPESWEIPSETPKARILNFILGAGEPVMAPVIGDALGIDDTIVHHYVEILVDEGKIGMTLEPGAVQDRKYKKRTYHPPIGVSYRA